MKLPDLMKKYELRLKELEKLYKEVVSKENETRRLTQLVERLETEYRQLEAFFLFVLFKDFAIKDIETLKFPNFTMIIDKQNERVVFTQLGGNLWRLHDEGSLVEFLDAVIQVIEKNLTSWNEHLSGQLKRLKARHKELKERYELLKGLKAFVSK